MSSKDSRRSKSDRRDSASQVSKESKDSRESKESKESKDSKDSKDSSRRSSDKRERQSRSSTDGKSSRGERERKSSSNGKDEQDRTNTTTTYYHYPDHDVEKASRSPRGDASSSRAPEDEMSSHVPDQFPNQAPQDYSLPFRPPGASGLGAAADYYGDQGESVLSQPGFRPHTPIITDAEPHLMAALPESKPPVETGSGSAAEFYESAAVGAGTAAAVSQAGGSSNGKPAKTTGSQGTTYSSFAAAQGSSRPSKPSKQSSGSSHSNIPLAAAAVGAAGLGAVAWEHHHEHSQQNAQYSAQSSSQSAKLSGGYDAQASGSYDAKVSGGYDAQASGSYDARLSGSNGVGFGAAAAATAAAGYAGAYGASQGVSQGVGYDASYRRHDETSRGPLHRFVDWWKNYDDVRKMEAYTEYIGVCRHCFDPNTSIWDAPRKHHLGKRGSREFRNRSRVDKTKRYSSSSSSSSDSEGGGGKGLLAATGLASLGAGLGLAKVFGSGDSRDVQGRDSQFGSNQLDRRSSEGVQQSSRRSTVTGEYPSKRQYEIRRTSVRRRRSSQSPSRSHEAGAALGGAAAGVALAEASRHHHGQVRHHVGPEVRMPSDQHRHRREDGSFQNYDARMSGVPSKHDQHAQSSSSSDTDEGQGFFGGFFSPSSKKNRKSKSKRRSTDEGLVYKSSSSDNEHKRKASSKPGSSKRRKKDELGSIGPTQAIIGLGAATAALAAASARGNGKDVTDAGAIRNAKDRNRRVAPNAPPIGRREEPQEDGPWESVSDASTSSSVISGLAFGDFEPKSNVPKRRGSGSSNPSSRERERRSKRRSDGRRKPVVLDGPLETSPERVSSLHQPTSPLPPMQYIDPMPVSETITPVVSNVKDLPLDQPAPITPIQPRRYEARAATVDARPSKDDYDVAPAIEPPRKLSRAETLPARIPSNRDIQPDPSSQSFKSDRSSEGKRKSKDSGSNSFAHDAAIGAAVLGAAAGAYALSGSRSDGSKESRSKSRDSEPKRAEVASPMATDSYDVADARQPRRTSRQTSTADPPLTDTARIYSREAEQRYSSSNVSPTHEPEYREVRAPNEPFKYAESGPDPEGHNVFEGTSGSTSFWLPSKVKESVDVYDSGSDGPAQEYHDAAYEVRDPSESKASDPVFDDEIFDPNLFKKRGKVSSRRDSQAAAKRVLTDFVERYSEEPTSQASFFAPPEITPSGDRDIDAAAAIAAPEGQTQDYFDVESPRRTRFEVGGRPVPTLNIIAPTPPESVAGSVRGDRSPSPSPLRDSQETQPEQASDEAAAEVSTDARESSTRSVRWAEPEQEAADREIAADATASQPARDASGKSKDDALVESPTRRRVSWADALEKTPSEPPSRTVRWAEPEEKSPYEAPTKQVRWAEPGGDKNFEEARSASSALREAEQQERGEVPQEDYKPSAPRVRWAEPEPEAEGAMDTQEHESGPEQPSITEYSERMATSSIDDEPSTREARDPAVVSKPRDGSAEAAAEEESFFTSADEAEQGMRYETGDSFEAEDRPDTSRSLPSTGENETTMSDVEPRATDDYATGLSRSKSADSTGDNNLASEDFEDDQSRTSRKKGKKSKKAVVNDVEDNTSSRKKDKSGKKSVSISEPVEFDDYTSSSRKKSRNFSVGDAATGDIVEDERSRDKSQRSASTGDILEDLESRSSGKKDKKSKKKKKSWQLEWEPEPEETQRAAEGSRDVAMTEESKAQPPEERSTNDPQIESTPRKSRSSGSWGLVASAIAGAGASIAADRESSRSTNEPVKSSSDAVAGDRSTRGLSSSMPGGFEGENESYEDAIEDTASPMQETGDSTKDVAAAEQQPTEASFDDFMEASSSKRRKKKSKRQSKSDASNATDSWTGGDFDEGRASQSKDIDESRDSESVPQALTPGQDEDPMPSGQGTFDQDIIQPSSDAFDDVATGHDASPFSFPTESQEVSESNLLPQMRAISSSANEASETRRPLPTELTMPTTPKALRRISYGSYQPIPGVESYGEVPEMIPLPDSRPGSPYGDEEIETPQRLAIQTSQLSTPRSPSSTAVPIRFRRPAESPGINRDLPAQSPILPDASSPFVANRRGSRPNSTEFKTSNEFRPLYLVERNRKIPELESSLPSLPSSRTSSRAPSVQDTEDDYESAAESPVRSRSPAGSQIVSEQVVEAPVYADDNMDSQQTTPRASAFPSDVFRSPSRAVDWSEAQFDHDQGFERGGFEQATPLEHPLSVQETMSETEPSYEPHASMEFGSPLPLLPTAEADAEQVHGAERSMELDSPLPLLPKDDEVSEEPHEAQEPMELDSPLPLLPKDDDLIEQSHESQSSRELTSKPDASNEAQRSAEHVSALPLLPREGEDADSSRDSGSPTGLETLPLLPKDDELAEESHETQSSRALASSKSDTLQEAQESAELASPLPLLPTEGKDADLSHNAERPTELQSPLTLLPKDAEEQQEEQGPSHEAERSGELGSPLPLLPKDGEEGELSQEAERSAELESPLPLLPKDGEEDDASQEAEYSAALPSSLPLLPKDEEAEPSRENNRGIELAPTENDAETEEETAHQAQQSSGLGSPLSLLPKDGGSEVSREDQHIGLDSPLPLLSKDENESAEAQGDPTSVEQDRSLYQETNSAVPSEHEDGEPEQPDADTATQSEVNHPLQTEADRALEQELDEEPQEYVEAHEEQASVAGSAVQPAVDHSMEHDSDRSITQDPVSDTFAPSEIDDAPTTNQSETAVEDMTQEEMNKQTNPLETEYTLQVERGTIGKALDTDMHMSLSLEDENDVDQLNAEQTASDPMDVDSEAQVLAETSRSIDTSGQVDGPESEQEKTVDLPTSSQAALEDDTDFAATVAAGLEGSGFDPNLVIDDPEFRKRDLTTESAALEPEEFSFVPAKGKKKKKGSKSASIPEPAAPEPEDDWSIPAKGKKSKKSGSKSSAPAEQATVEPEEASSVAPKGKKKKKSGSKAATFTDPDPVETAPEPEPAPEEDWFVPTKGKKGKKSKSKGVAWTDMPAEELVQEPETMQEQETMVEEPETTQEPEMMLESQWIEEPETMQEPEIVQEPEAVQEPEPESEQGREIEPELEQELEPETQRELDHQLEQEAEQEPQQENEQELDQQLDPQSDQVTQQELPAEDEPEPEPEPEEFSFTPAKGKKKKKKSGTKDVGFSDAATAAEPLKQPEPEEFSFTSTKGKKNKRSKSKGLALPESADFQTQQDPEQTQEPEPEPEEFSFTPARGKKNKKSSSKKKDKSQSVPSPSPLSKKESSQTEPPYEEPSFDDIVTAGLAGAGFAALGRSSSTPAQAERAISATSDKSRNVDMEVGQSRSSSPGSPSSRWQSVPTSKARSDDGQSPTVERAEEMEEGLAPGPAATDVSEREMITGEDIEDHILPTPAPPHESEVAQDGEMDDGLAPDPAIDASPAPETTVADEMERSLQSGPSTMEPEESFSQSPATEAHEPAPAAHIGGYLSQDPTTDNTFKDESIMADDVLEARGVDQFTADISERESFSLETTDQAPTHASGKTVTFEDDAGSAEDVRQSQTPGSFPDETMDVDSPAAEDTEEIDAREPSVIEESQKETDEIEEMEEGFAPGAIAAGQRDIETVVPESDMSIAEPQQTSYDTFGDDQDDQDEHQETQTLLYDAQTTSSVEQTTIAEDVVETDANEPNERHTGEEFVETVHSNSFEDEHAAYGSGHDSEGYVFYGPLTRQEMLGDALSDLLEDDTTTGREVSEDEPMIHEYQQHEPPTILSSREDGSDNHRDSAVHVLDTPATEQQPFARQTIRDSGYHDGSPIEAYKDEEAGTERDPSDTDRAYDEADEEFDEEAAIGLHQSELDEPLQSRTPEADSRVPSPVDSTTKDRTSYLFQTPPREAIRRDSLAEHEYEHDASIREPTMDETTSAMPSNNTGGLEPQVSHNRSPRLTSPTQAVTFEEPAEDLFDEPDEDLFDEPATDFFDESNVATQRSTREGPTSKGDVDMSRIEDLVDEESRIDGTFAQEARNVQYPDTEGLAPYESATKELPIDGSVPAETSAEDGSPARFVPGEPIAEESHVEEPLARELTVKEPIIEGAVAEEAVKDDSSGEATGQSKSIIESAFARGSIVEDPVPEEADPEERPSKRASRKGSKKSSRRASKQATVEDAPVEELVTTDPNVEDPVVKQERGLSTASWAFPPLNVETSPSNTADASAVSTDKGEKRLVDEEAKEVDAFAAQPRELIAKETVARVSSPTEEDDKQTLGLERSISATTQDAEHDRSIISPAASEVSANMRRPYARRSSGDLKSVDSQRSLRAASAKSSPSLSGEGQAVSSGRTRKSPSTQQPKLQQPSESYQPLKGSGRDRRQESMSETGSYEGYGDAPKSPISPSRSSSVRERHASQISDLETQLNQALEENRALKTAQTSGLSTEYDGNSRGIDAPSEDMNALIESRDAQLREKDLEISTIRASVETLQQEVARLSEHNEQLQGTDRGLPDDNDERFAALNTERDEAHRQWQDSSRELEELRERHGRLTEGMEGIVREEVAAALTDKDAEIRTLRAELDRATDQIRTLQRQIMASSAGGDYLNVRDEDYFDSACQQLCQHVQQWVLRFSKFSDTRVCRLSTEIRNEQIETRLDNAILDGTDVDTYLADRIRRRDVFMSVVMTMVWEFVFTRYLFGMDRDQRQKLKALEKILTEVGPPRAVAQWRATTLTLLSRRRAFAEQRAQDTEAVVQEIYSTLATMLPPPGNLVNQIQESLRNVMRLAVDLSIEMRTQRAEYIMLPPLHPEYDSNGDLIRQVYFNASLMNERSGEFSSNEDLEAKSSVVRLVLFPLVVKKGNEHGETDEEVVVCPAQVLVSKPSEAKRMVRVMSANLSIDNPNTSMRSLSPSTLDIGSA